MEAGKGGGLEGKLNGDYLRLITGLHIEGKTI